MLLARENTSLHIREAAALLQFRLSETMRNALHLPSQMTWVASRAEASRRWEENVRATLRRQILDLMDPYPVERHTAKSWEQIQQILDQHDTQLETIRRARLDEFMHRFIAMTYNLQSRSLRRRSSKIDLSIDQTPMAPPTKKGYSPKHLAEKIATERKARQDGRALTPAPVDPFAGWYPMKGDRADIKPGSARDQTSPQNPGSGSDLAWGWALNIAMRVDSGSPRAPRFPGIIAAATLSMPNVGTSEQAVTLMRHAASEDLDPGIVDGDMQYFGNALPERLHEPTRALGYTPSTEYRIDRLGRPQGEKDGVQFIDGGMYCPSTPDHLKTAALDWAKREIDDDTFHKRRVERRSFQVHVKEKPNERGKFRVSCPARGNAPTVTCPVIEMSTKAADRDRPGVEDPPDFLPDICRQHAITMDVSDNIRQEQAFEYGSPEQNEFHSYARQSIESLNKGIKEDHLESLKTPGRRRVRGFAAAAFAATILIVNYNIRKIASFLHDEMLAGAQGTVPESETRRRRDRDFFNAYTGTTPKGLKVPERVEQRGTLQRRRSKRTAGALPNQT